MQKGPLGFVSSRAHHSREIEIVAREEGYLAQDSLLTKATQLLSFPCLYFGRGGKIVNFQVLKILTKNIFAKGARIYKNQRTRNIFTSLPHVTL